MSSRTKTLPPEEQKLLRKIRDEGDLPLLRARVKVLRDAGWTLAAIGEPLDSGRSTVRMWERSADPDTMKRAKALAPVEECYRLPYGVREGRIPIDVPVNERKELHELANKAREVRGWTPKNSPDRKAADELTRRLIEYTERGVPVKRIAQHMGVTHRAVAARIGRARAKVSA